MEALHLVTSWPVEHVTAAVVTAAGSDTIGDTERIYRLASLTKPMVAWAVMVGVEEGIVALDAPLRFATAPDGVTLRHLLAHAGGFGFDGDEPIAAPARRRIYSNTGIERAADELAAAAGMAFHGLPARSGVGTARHGEHDAERLASARRARQFERRRALRQ